MNTLKGLAVAAAVAMAPSMASAADVHVSPPPMVAPAAPAETPFDILFGVTVTTDYISRGITQTNHGFALQGYVEVDFYDFYVNLWASNVSYPGVSSDTLETDWAIGWRPTLGPLSLDIGYVRYVYFPTGWSGSSGEAYLKASVNPVEPLTIGGAFFINPANSATYLEGNLAYALPMNLKASGAVGVVNSGGTSYLAWNAGLSYTWNDLITVDVRYWDSSLSPAGCASFTTGSSTWCDARIVGSISLNSSLKSLRMIK